MHEIRRITCVLTSKSCRTLVYEDSDDDDDERVKVKKGSKGKRLAKKKEQPNRGTW